MKSLLLILVLAATTITVCHARQFGAAVAVDGDLVLVGDGNSPAVPGFVYVFARNTATDANGNTAVVKRTSTEVSGEWIETVRIAASDSDGAVDAFGKSFAIHRNTMVVGAPGVNKVYFFLRAASGAWTEVAQLKGEGEQFGSAVAINGSHVLVAAPSTKDVPGSVSVFELSTDGTWNPAGELVPDDVEAGDGYGSVLALGDGLAYVSAPAAASGSGTVYSFVRNPETNMWEGKGQIEAPSRQDGDGFGSSLLLAENALAIGAPGYSNGTGLVFLFEREADLGDFVLLGHLSPFVAERNAGFGSAIALSGERLWVGAPGFGGRRGTGVVFEFDIDPSTMAVRGTRIIQSPPLQARSQYGAAIAVNSRIAVVGAPGYDNRAGVAFPLSADAEFDAVPLINDIFGYESITGGLTECKEDAAGDFPCKDVDMMSFLSMDDMGADRGVRTNDLWGWEDTETGREYAIVGLSNQTSFVDVSDPYNPIFLGELDMPESAYLSIWRDMKVYKDHAYIVSDGAGEHGIQIFDLRLLRDVENPPVVFEETAHYSGIFSAHNIVINEETGFAYAVGSSAGGETCGGGLHMIDLRDPENPIFAGCFSDGVSGRRGTGYSHDAQCVVYHGPDTDYQGHEICIGSNETVVSISDVTDKDNPVGIAIASYPGVAYAHQGWLSEDHRYFFLNDELDEVQGIVETTRTLIWDFIDLDEPELAGEFLAETTETDHNLYVKGDFVYQSITSAGLRILDISNPTEPFETAYFDTSPVGGRGVSWSNYPYFKSGIIVVTGGHYGLFILKKKEVDI